MKTTLLKTILALGAVAGFLAMPTLATADDHNWHHGSWDRNHHFFRDHDGYWNNNVYSNYIWYGGHRGYWDDRGGVRVFINVD